MTGEDKEVGMSRNGLNRSAAALLLLAAGGCLSVPPVPQHARGQAAAETEEGIPLGRILSGFGRGSGESPPPQVVPAVAVEDAGPPPPGSPGPTSPAPVSPNFGGEEDEDSGFQLSDLAPSNVYKNLKTLAGYGPDEEVARGFYREGEALYAEKRYREAASRFKAAAGRWPDSTLEEDALFMAGESCFFADDYPKANDYYEKLLKKYEYSQHLDAVVARLFAIGRYWEQLHALDPSWPIEPNFFDGRRPLFDTWGNAIKCYDVVRMHDPTGPLADDSVMATANAYFLKTRYEEASYNYDLLRKEYPRSEHQIPAHLLSMKSKMEMYQGPMYDGACLEEAGEVAEQTLAQFRSELGDQRELVVRTRNRVTEEKGARDWTVAQYYDKKKCYGAARIYYRAVAEEYPQTGFAEQARARLEEIRGLPDQPPDHFRWLGDLFPDEEPPARSFSKTTPLGWVRDQFRGEHRPSEEFRDEQSP